MTIAARKLTYADYARIPEDGNRHEIIEGEWYMTPAPRTDHQRVSVRLTTLLENFSMRTKSGCVLAAPTDVLLSEHDIVQPDILFVAEARASIIEPEFVRGAPDLVIEVLSPATASVDRGRKLSLYDRSGVREYWIVDPDSKTVEVHEFGSPRRVKVHDARGAIRCSAIEGFEVRVIELFE